MRGDGWPPTPRILTFIHSLELGGVERSALALCRAWRAAGIDAPLYVGRAEGVLAAETAKDEMIVGRGRWFPRRWCETLWMLLTLPGVIRAVRPDILFCAGNTYSVVAVAMRLLLGRRCPPIVLRVTNDLTRRDMPRGLRGLYHLWCRLQGLWIDQFVALSPQMRVEIMAVMGVTSRRITIVRGPVFDRKGFDRLRAAGRRARAGRGEGRRFIAIGRLVAQKRFDLLLAAFAGAAQPQDSLLLVGDGAHRRRLERQAVRLGLSDRVRFVGHSADVARWLSRADILLLSSAYEGVPAVAIEAMAASLPIVSTDCSGTMRAIVSASGGIVAPAFDRDALTAAIAAATPASAHRPEAECLADLHRDETAAFAYATLVRTLRADPWFQQTAPLGEQIV